jgi:hypothetical protein
VAGAGACRGDCQLEAGNVSVLAAVRWCCGAEHCEQFGKDSTVMIVSLLEEQALTEQALTEQTISCMLAEWRWRENWCRLHRWCCVHT